MAKYKFDVPTLKALAVVNAANPQSFGPVTYTGEGAEMLLIFLEGAIGAFGHPLDLEHTSPIDLHSALIDKLGPEAVIPIGRSQNMSYELDLPDDALST